jgi:hypothetical protein
MPCYKISFPKGDQYIVKAKRDNGEVRDEGYQERLNAAVGKSDIPINPQDFETKDFKAALEKPENIIAIYDENGDLLVGRYNNDKKEYEMTKSNQDYFNNKDIGPATKVTFFCYRENGGADPNSFVVAGNIFR